MKFRASIFGIALACLAIAPYAAADSGGERVAYTSGHWLDLSGEQPVWHLTDRHARDGVFLDHAPKTVDRTVALDGRWIVPPLSEAHNHAVEGVWSRDTATALLELGVYYYRNPSNVAAEANANRDYWARRDTIDVVFSHGAFTVAGDHPEPLYRQLARLYGLDADDLDGRALHALPDIVTLEARWPVILADRPDFIKLILLDSTGENPGGVPVDVAQRAVELAHAAGLMVMAHTWTAGDVATALRVGVDEVAHLPGYVWRDLPRESFVIDEELARALAEAGTVVNTTAVVASERGDPWRQPGWQPGAQAHLQRENLRQLVAAGVTLAIGTDQMRPTIDEVDYLRTLDVMSDATLLRTWFAGAALIFPERRLGFDPGDEASFVALACDPFAEFDCIRAPVHLEKQGLALPIGELP